MATPKSGRESMMQGRITETETSETQTDYPKINAPADFTPPDDKQVGDEWDATMRIRLEDGGKLCLLTMDGMPLKGGEQETEEVTEEAEEEVTEEAPAAPQTLQEAVAMERQQTGRY
jgi:hypothetical protein